MGIEEKMARARAMLESCERPVFVFDDDCDGLASFLLCHSHIGKGTPIVIKSSPNLTEKFASIINGFNPDLVMILDIALVQQEALGMIGCDVIWIDHHEPQEPLGALYINPQAYDEDYPTAMIVHNMIGGANWLCVAGCISDYYYPHSQVEMVREEYPELLGDNSTIDSIHYKSGFGRVIDILGFSMKGTAKDALSLIKVLCRAKNPRMLMEDNNDFRKVISHYNNVKKKYDELREDALCSFKEQEGMLKVFLYESQGWSLTHELSSELASYYPDSVIVVGRPYNSKLLLSLRSRNNAIKDNLDRVMASFDGTGGGHPNACGANIPREDAQRFMDMLEESFVK